MINKINPIEQSYRPGAQGHGSDGKEQEANKKKKDGNPDFGPAVVNHIVPNGIRMQMKQLQLPIDGLGLDLKVFELYLHRDPKARYKVYGTHIDFTLAESLNQAEEMFSNTYPTWWRTMGVKESTAQEVVTKLEMLEEQTATCKFVLLALNIDL
jgi:hypothetical protein